MFDAVSQRLNEMSVNSQLAPVNISVVEPAYPSDAPSSPKVGILLFLGFFGSLGLGLGLVMLLNQFNTSLRTVDAAEEFLQLPVLTAIPRLKLDPLDFHDRLVVASRSSHSAEVELFRTLRACISMLGESERRSFLFTSSFPKEGKTFTSCNFAASLAQQGLRTVVFDLDLHSPARGISDRRNQTDPRPDRIAGEQTETERGRSNPSPGAQLVLGVGRHPHFQPLGIVVPGAVQKGVGTGPQGL